MSLFTKLGNDIASPVDAAGNKRSVDNGDMQVWMTEVERLSAAKAMGAVTFGTLAQANGSLAYDPWTTAWVLDDPVVGNNGWYTKTGASGVGGWVRVGDLPYCYIRATNAGAGSANAIVATTTMPIPVADGGALISLNITSSNTAKPVTVSFNGAPPLTIKTNAGNNPVIGGLVAGMTVAGYKVGAEFRLLSDQASAAIVLAAEEAAIRAENAAGSIIANASFKTVADLLADDNNLIGYAGSGAAITVVPDDIVNAQGFRYEVAASGATDHHVETAGGVKLYVQPGPQGYAVAAFGDMSTDAYSALSKAPDGSFMQPGTYALSASVMGKSFWSVGSVAFTGNGYANVVDVTKEMIAGLASVDAGGYVTETTLNYVSGPSLVVTKSGRIIAFFGLGDSHTGGNGTTCPLVYRIYNRATNTWGTRQILSSKTGFSSRNQVAGVTPTGRIWVAYFQCEYAAGVMNTATQATYYRYSDDDGLTWSAEQRLDLYMDYPASTGQVTIPYGSLVAFSNGDLLITVYRFRVIMTLRSTDNGATWGTPYSGGATPHPNSNRVQMWTSPNWGDDNITEPTIAKIDDSRLVATCRSVPSGLAQDGSARLKFLGRRWTSSARVEVGMYCSTSDATRRVYKCTVAGTTGSSAPTHTSGTATDGTVTWEYVDICLAWEANTAVSLGNYIESRGTYLYIVTTAGTTDAATAPYASKFEGNETQLATIRSSDGGLTWKSPEFSTWTAATWHATTSPPRAIIRGGDAYIAWFARSPEWTLYLVKMGAHGFFENPKWAFNLADNEPRQRIQRSYLSALASNYDYRVNCGYVDLLVLPWTNKIMMSWYDCPLLDAVKTSAYSIVIDA